MVGFLLKRYPQLKVRETVTNLSIACANATRKSSVLAWYKKYENVLKQLEITDPNTFGTLTNMVQKICQK